MDGKKVKLRLEHISQSYIVKNEVSDAVVDGSYSAPGAAVKLYC